MLHINDGEVSLMKNTLVIGAIAFGLVMFLPPAHALIPGLEEVDIGVGVELEYGVRKLELMPPAAHPHPRLREAESIVASASLKLTAETIEGFSLFLAPGMAEVDIKYTDRWGRSNKVIGKDGKLVELGFRWCAPATDVGLPVEDVRVGISYRYQVIMSDIEKRIRGGVTERLHPKSEIEIKRHEVSLFLSEWLDFLTLYVGGRYSDILEMEIEVPGEPIIEFAPREKAGIVIGADIPLGDLLAGILPLPVDINLNFEVEAIHEASIRLGGSIIF
jgi:hypothetical protein